MNRPRSYRLRALCLGGVVSAALLYFAFRDMDWFALGNALAHVRPDALGLCALMIAAGIVLRGWRWCLIAGRPFRAVGVFSRAVNLGVLGNQLLPGRLGEAVRIAVLVRLLSTSVSESLGSTVLDRMLDACVLLLSAWLVSVVVAAGVIPSSWVAGLGGLLACLAGGVALTHTRGFHSWFSSWSARWLQHWALRPTVFLVPFNAMVRRMVRPDTFAVVLTAAAAVWIADYLAVAAALWSTGLDLPITAPLLLWVMLAAGSALPSAPGYIGIYQIAAVWGLSIYSVPAHQAIATAFVLQLVTLGVSLVGGGHETAKLLLRTKEVISTRATP